MAEEEKIYFQKVARGCRGGGGYPFWCKIEEPGGQKINLTIAINSPPPSPPPVLAGNCILLSGILNTRFLSPLFRFPSNLLHESGPEVFLWYIQILCKIWCEAEFLLTRRIDILNKFKITMTGSQDFLWIWWITTYSTVWFRPHPQPWVAPGPGFRSRPVLGRPRLLVREQKFWFFKTDYELSNIHSNTCTST